MSALSPEEQAEKETRKQQAQEHLQKGLEYLRKADRTSQGLSHEWMTARATAATAHFLAAQLLSD